MRSKRMLAIAALSVGWTGPASAQMDWLTPHLDAQRFNNLLLHQQRQATQNQDAPATGSEEPAHPEIVETQFIAYLLEKDGTRRILEDDTVPLLPMQGCWQWGLRFGNQTDAVAFEETLTLPAPAGAWVGGDANVYSSDGRSATKHSVVAPDNGWIGNAWCVAEDDPAGAYNIVVRIDGAIVAEFDFEVAEAP